MSKLKLLWPIGILFLAGCFPLELDVNSKGEVLIYRGEGFLIYDPASGKATPIAGPANGAPAFARFAPDGKHILTVVKDFGFRFDLVPLDGGPSRTLFRADNTTYALFSPNGAQLAVTRLADEKRFKEAPQAVPELHLIEVGDGAKQLLTSSVGACFRWFADSKRLLLCKVTNVDKNGLYSGQLEEYDVATRTSKPLAAILCDARMIVDLSADNTRVLFTARVAGRPGESLTPDAADDARHLFELQLTDLSVVKLKESTDFARYSPSGKKILLHSTEGLLVADMTEKYFTTVVEQQENLPSSATALPGWIGDDTIYFFQERETYGTTVKGLALVTIKTDGTGRQIVQPTLDRAAIQAETKYKDQRPSDEAKPLFPKTDGKPRPEGGGGASGTAGDWDYSMILAAVGFAVVLLVYALIIVVRNARRVPVEDGREAVPHPSQAVLRGLATLLALIGCGTTAFLAVRWHEQVNDPKVKEVREMLPLIKILGQADQEAKIHEELATLEKRGKVLCFLYASIALGFIGGILCLLRIQPGFASALMLTAVAAPAIFIPVSAVFTSPFLIGAVFASRLKPTPPPLNAGHVNAATAKAFYPPIIPS